MTTAKVAISADFLTAFAHLPRQVQGKVTELVNKFRNDPASPGIHYEKINSCIDKKIYSIRIDDAYRGIVVRQSEVYLLLWVDHHDEAYQWAARKRCEVNPNTGSLQVFDVQTVSEPIAAHSQPLLFSAFKDADLLRLSVPEALLPYVRSFETKEQFYQARSSFPADAYEYLAWLAEGFSMEEVLDIVVMGRAARNTANIKNRQPIGTMYVKSEFQLSELSRSTGFVGSIGTAHYHAVLCRRGRGRRTAPHHGCTA